MPLLPKPLIFSSVETLKISIFPRENQCFSGFPEKHVCANFVYFSFQKSSKNPSKTRSEPFKNRCRKRVDFQHWFFEVLASIWEGLGPPRWSQVGSRPEDAASKSLKGFFFGCLKLNVCYKLRLGGLQAPFWRLQGSILEGLEMIFLYFGKLFGMLPRRRPSFFFFYKISLSKHR